MGCVQCRSCLDGLLVAEDRNERVEAVASAWVYWQGARLVHHKQFLRLFHHLYGPAVQDRIFPASDSTMNNELPIPQHMLRLHWLSIHGHTTSCNGGLVVVPRKRNKFARANLKQSSADPSLLHMRCEVEIVWLHMS